MGNSAGVKGKPKTQDKREDIICSYFTKTSNDSSNVHVKQVPSQAEQSWGSYRGRDGTVLTRIGKWILKRIIQETPTVYTRIKKIYTYINWS